MFNFFGRVLRKTAVTVWTYGGASVLSTHSSVETITIGKIARIGIARTAGIAYGCSDEKIITTNKLLDFESAAPIGITLLLTDLVIDGLISCNVDPTAALSMTTFCMGFVCWKLADICAAHEQQPDDLPRPMLQV